MESGKVYFKILPSLFLSDSAEDVFIKLKSIEENKNCFLPKCYVIIGNFIRRTNKLKAKGMCNKASC